MEKKHSLSIFLILSCIVLLSILSVSIYRQYKLDSYLQCKLPEFNRTLVTEWLNALKTDNPKKAILTASKMVPRSTPYVPFPYYLNLTTQNGINSRFFNPPFTMLDYLYWKDMYNIRSIVKNIQQNPNIKNIPKHIFNTIFKEVKLIKHTAKSQRSTFLYEIWNKKQCDILDKYLLFSEFMTQAGYDVQIVVLFSDIKKIPIHIIAEIRNTDKVYTCDFFTGSFWIKSVRELTIDKSLLKQVWKQKWINGLDHIIFKTEISAMSYRKINQHLHEYLAKGNNKSIPIIGLDPYKKMKNYKRNFYSNDSSISFELGVEPFTMIKNSKFFPKK